MNTYPNQKIGLLPIVADSLSPAIRKGVRYGVDAQSGGASGVGVLYSIYPSHFPARHRADSGCDSRLPATHRHRHFARRGTAGQGTLERFSSGGVLAGLVELAAGAGARGVGA